MLENDSVNFNMKHANTVIELINLKCVTQSCDNTHYHKNKMQSTKSHLNVYAHTLNRLDCLWLCCCVQQPIGGSLKERQGRTETWINAAGGLQVTALSWCVHVWLMHGFNTRQR